MLFLVKRRKRDYNYAMRHVYLIGLPGSGKTTLGALTARALGRPFYDMDEYIERKTGQTISELFADIGEAAFRIIESDTLMEIAQNTSGIVATGGGTPLSPKNAPTLNAGYTIFIDRPPEEIAKTVDYTTRPLLPGAEALFALDAARRPAYEQLMDARIRSETVDSGVKEVLDILIEQSPIKTSKLRLAVVGDPVEHSLSPILHNSLYRLLGINASYEKLRLPKGRLSELLVQSPPLFGCNITMPHKEDAAALAKRTKPAGLKSVNTLKFTPEGIVGTSTDGLGFLKSVADIELCGARAVLLGAGGAARVVAEALLERGAARVALFNRTKEKALALANELQNVAARAAGASKECEGFGLCVARLEAECARADILINATPCGMEGVEGFPLSFVEALPKGAFVYDLVYRPNETPLLRAAKTRGLQTRNGLAMLLWQGIYAHEFWFGGSVPEAIALEVLQYLKEKV